METQTFRPSLGFWSSFSVSKTVWFLGCKSISVRLVGRVYSWAPGRSLRYHWSHIDAPLIETSSLFRPSALRLRVQVSTIFPSCGKIGSWSQRQADQSVTFCTNQVQTRRRRGESCSTVDWTIENLNVLWNAVPDGKIQKLRNNFLGQDPSKGQRQRPARRRSKPSQLRKR